MRRWYLEPWFISVMFVFSFLVIPLIVGVALLILHYAEVKRLRLRSESEIREKDALLTKYGIDDIIRLEADKRALGDAIAELQSRYQTLGEEFQKRQLALSSEFEARRQKLMGDEAERVHQFQLAQQRFATDEAELSAQIAARRRQLIEIDEEIALQEAGMYKPLYDFGNSERYAQEIERIRDMQKELIKRDRYANFNPNWTVNGSQAEGKRMIEQNKKGILRAFNSECDAIISAVTYKNFGALEQRIQKSFEQLNKLNTKLGISLRHDYLHLKLQELRLVHEYQLKKQAEKEEQIRIREMMREEEKARIEIERQKARIAKEKQHFLAELAKMKARLSTAGEAEQPDLRTKIEELQSQLGDLANKEQDIENYERNTRAGFVYVISNIGSFGEHVYKIGMTRRLEPEERVHELGDASVPFKFDIHAIIFSEDAPTLEATLHREFQRHQVNKVNHRKEFFRVSLDEIESVVKANHDKTVEFVTTAAADEYRQTLAIERAKPA